MRSIDVCSQEMKDFNESFWSAGVLEIPEDLIPVLEQLKEELRHVDLPIVHRLMTGQPPAWTREEIKDLEKAILTRAGERLAVSEVPRVNDFGQDVASELPALMNCLAKVVDRIIQEGEKKLCRPRTFRRVHPEINPFHADLPNTEEVMRQMRQLVQRGFARKLKDVDDLIALALLSSISHLLLIDQDTQVAWIRALAHPKDCSISLSQSVVCIQLEVTFRDQQNAERRLYISPDHSTCRLLRRIPANKVREILAEFGSGAANSDSYAARIQLQRRRRKAVLQYLELVVKNLVAKLSFGQGTLTLTSATRAARTAAYLRVPAGVAAYRSRKMVSHSARIAVIKRIAKDCPVPAHDASQSDFERNFSEPDDSVYLGVDAEVHDTAGTEPKWYAEVCAAFRLSNKKAVSNELVRISETSEGIGRRISEFARYLLGKHSIGTASRYSLLIGRRLGCWQDGDRVFDPKDLSVSELESIYEEILEDEREEYATEEDELGMYDKRPLIEAISRFHNFLREKYGIGELVELKDRLRFSGLLPVDANFITIDEYQHVLRSIDSDATLNDPYLRNAIKLFVSVCFWCGLRREEAIGLRIMDLDSANHLHVRPYRNRHLKTGNANRSVPAADLMRDHFPSLHNWVTSRQSSPCSSAPALIFSRPHDSSKPIPKQFIYSKALEHMRVALHDPSLKIHHLRHSFATLLAIRLLPGMNEFASKLFARHPMTLTMIHPEASLKFRQGLFKSGQVRREDFAAIALLLGHGSPAMSIEHYIHCLDWCRALGNG